MTHHRIRTEILDSFLEKAKRHSRFFSSCFPAELTGAAGSGEFSAVPYLHGVPFYRPGHFLPVTGHCGGVILKTIKIILPHSIYRDFLIISGICNISAHNLIIQLVEIESHEHIVRQLHGPDRQAPRR